MASSQNSPKTIHILMEGTPEHLSAVEIKLAMERVNSVEDVHHIHVWNIDEHRVALEAHVVLSASEFKEVELIKANLKKMLFIDFNVDHSTLEFEHYSEKNANDDFFVIFLYRLFSNRAGTDGP